MALDKEDFAFPDEKEEKKLNESIEAKVGDNDIAIEIEDDTPPEDRDRKPLPKEMVEELEKDDLTDYSDRVRERMSQLKKVYHDERREKEAAAREREEAIRFAQSIAEENKRLKSTLTSGEEVYIKTLFQSAEQELNYAKREYRDAYDSGDTEKLIEAQQRMNQAQMSLSQLANYQPQYKNTLQERETPVNIQPDRPQVPKPDRKALAWQDKNDWFGKNRTMTGAALGLHEDLVAEGYDPTSDEYYARIDKTMRKSFPDYFQDDSQDEDSPPPSRNKASTVVAPATRSTAPKKVRLSTTQLALAKKLGLTPEQYAREAMKLENR